MEAVPDVKLIFCLRNPIERAWANYRFTVLEGLEPLSFDDAIETESSRVEQAKGKWAEVQPHAYLLRSHYFYNIMEYKKIFPEENILIIKSEDLGENPKDNLSRICEFLNVSSFIDLPLPLNYSSPSVKNRMLQIELREYFGNRFSEFVECIRMEKNVSFLEQDDNDHSNVIRLRKNLDIRKNPLADSTRRHLQLLFEHELSILSEIVDFTLDDWN
jgi:hypothetical protein